MMRKPTSARSIRLTDQQTLHDTMIVGRQHISLSANGYRCQTDDLWRLLLAAAARHTTIEASCADLPAAPHANTVRGYLSDQLPSAGIDDLEQQWNALLRSLLPDWLRVRAQELAIDFHDQPYYGREQPGDGDNWVCRGQARAGTTLFYRCATAYIGQRDARLTVAVVFVKPTMDTLTILTKLLSEVKAAGIRIKCLYADKGFCYIPVLRYLMRRHMRAIIAMPIRGKQAGTRQLCHGPISYRTAYTLHSGEHGHLSVPTAVVRTYQRRRSGRRQLRWLVYVCLRVGGPVIQVRRRYRRRFGIESGYRLMEQVRARTSTPNPALRFLLMGVALLIVNMWIRLHWLFLRLPGRGRPRVARWHFRLERMTRFLTRAIERFYGVVTAVDLSPF
jgi:Transposase DDE domain